MSFQAKVGRSVAVAVAVIGLGAFSAASAQEITPEHEAAARSALDALGITEQFNGILPNQADLVQSQLTQVYPNYSDLIDQVVTDTAIKLASRRSDLETEAAQIYAKVFSQDELTKLAEFYSSDVGKKFIQYGPIAARELSQAGDIWARGIARDLNTEAQQELNTRITAQSGDAAPAKTE